MTEFVVESVILSLARDRPLNAVERAFNVLLGGKNDESRSYDRLEVIRAVDDNFCSGLVLDDEERAQRLCRSLARRHGASFSALPLDDVTRLIAATNETLRHAGLDEHDLHGARSQRILVINTLAWLAAELTWRAYEGARKRHPDSPRPPSYEFALPMPWDATTGKSVAAAPSKKAVRDAFKLAAERYVIVDQPHAGE